MSDETEREKALSERLAKEGSWPPIIYFHNSSAASWRVRYRKKRSWWQRLLWRLSWPREK